MYRLEVLEERIRAKMKERKGGEAKRSLDVDDTRRFLIEQKEFLESMLEEIV